MSIPENHPAVLDAIRKGMIAPATKVARGGTGRQDGRPRRTTAMPAADSLFAETDHREEYHPDPVRYLDEVPAGQVVARCVHEGEPLGKQRPRFNKKTGRVYTPGATKAHQRALAALVEAELAGSPADGAWAFGIRAAFFVQTHQRKDVDNMLKAVLDAMNRLVFADDSQVKELMGWGVMDGLRPRTELVVYRLHPIDRETGACVRCGETFRRYKSWKQRRYCSQSCYIIATRQAVEVACAHCGKELLRKPSDAAANVGGNFYCSAGCRGLHTRKEYPCFRCGKPVSRPQSTFRPGQRRYFCSMACRSADQTGQPSPVDAERLAARAKKGWETRRAKAAAP